MTKIRFTKPAYMPVGAVVKLSAEQREHRQEQIRPVGGRGGWFRVIRRTGYLEGMEAEVREVPPELVATGAIEELPPSAANA